jgi:hypothetical protein
VPVNSPPTNSFQMAGEVARAVELETVALRAVQAAFNGQSSVPKLPVPVQVRITHSEKFILDPEGKLDVTIHFDVLGMPPKGATEGFDLHCDFVARYALHAGATFSEGHYSHFASLNALMNVWPYMRELVQSATSRMGLPSLVLTLFRIPSVSQGAPAATTAETAKK